MAGADNYADWVFSLLAPLVHGEVLEVGCGVGTFTARILATGSIIRLLATDTSLAAIRHCRQRFAGGKAEFCCAALDFIGGVWDLIICMNVLEHVADDRQMAEQLVDRLKPGGRLFVLVPAHASLFSEFDRTAGHYRRYTKASVRALFSGLDCQLDRQRYFNAIGAVGYFTVYKILGKEGSDPALSEVGLFDRLVVPVVRRLEPSWIPFGLSVVTTLVKSKP